MIWEDVDVGVVLQDVDRRLWVVTGKELCMDVVVVRIYCLSDPEFRGSKVYTPRGKHLKDRKWSVWAAG